MTVQFKTTDTQVQIKTDWNTRTLYLDERGRHNNTRTWIALTKFNLHQHTSGLRDTLERWERVLAVLRDNCRPCVLAAYVAAWLRFKARQATAPVRHYVGIIRVSRNYSL
jgi:hypothetical protein